MLSLRANIVRSGRKPARQQGFRYVARLPGVDVVGIHQHLKVVEWFNRIDLRLSDSRHSSIGVVVD
jgi:hypothetical protein